MKYTRDDVKSLGVILGVWAHPDDEAFTSAGLMAAAIENGQRVVLVTATKGSLGVLSSQNTLGESMTKIREKELKSYLAVIGVTNHSFLGYSDGELADCDVSEATEKVAQYIDDVAPDTVITFDLDGLTGHKDHRAVHEWVKKAVTKAKLSPRLLCAKENTQFYEKFGRELDERHDMYFNIECPDTVDREDVDVCFCLDKELKQKKLKAIKAHKSQTENLFKTKEDERAMDNMCNYECFADCPTNAV